MKNIENIEELRNELADAFQKTKTDEFSTKKLAELSNVAGKMINTCKVQLDYQVSKSVDVNIPFLEAQSSSLGCSKKD